MNIILSFFVCIAMLMSPMAVLPEQPETATTWTLSNLSVEFDGNSVTLPQEMELTAAVGTQEALLHFQINEGESVYMPMTGAITRDNVRFNLGNSERTYTVGQEAFIELTQMTDEDAEILKVAERMLLSYGKLLAAAQKPEFAVQHGEESWKLLETMLDAEPVKTEADVDGEKIPAVQLSGKMTGMGVLNMLDATLECGIAELKEYCTAIMELVNLDMDEPIAKFSDLAGDIDKEIDEEIDYEMNIIVTTREPLYACAEATADVDGMTIKMAGESIVRGDETTAVAVMEMDDGETQFGYVVDMSYTGPASNPSSLTIAAEVSSGIHILYDMGDDFPYVYDQKFVMEMNMDMTVVDELKNAGGDISMIVDSSYGFGVDGSSGNHEFGAIVDYAERLEPDGSVTGSFEMDAEIDKSPISVSFDLNRAEGDLADYFADTIEHPLFFDVEDEIHNLLAADSMLIAAAGMQLAADENIRALADMFMPNEDVNAFYENEESASDADLTESPAEDETGIVEVDTLEEAEEVFRGAMPTFTAPEGYELQYISADEYMVFASYYSDDSWFDFIVSDFGYDESTSHYILQNGALEPIDGRVFALTEDENGKITDASINIGGTTVEFYLGYCNIPEVENILSGLEF